MSWARLWNQRIDLTFLKFQTYVIKFENTKYFLNIGFHYQKGLFLVKILLDIAIFVYLEHYRLVHKVLSAAHT